MPGRPFASKTLDLEDLAQPEAARMARELRRFALRLGLSGLPFAVNGVLRQRFRARPHKLWEYARGLACVLGSTAERKGAMRVLDFGGGATLPVFYLAHRGAEVFSLDIEPQFTDWTNRIAAGRRSLWLRTEGWKLHSSTFDLAESPAPPEWGRFDAVISFSVLEHLHKDRQQVVLERLAALLQPGGVFALTFDYGPDAPVGGAVRDAAEVERLAAATRLVFLDGQPFADTGERFALDKRHPRRRFTFASLFLRKPA